MDPDTGELSSVRVLVGKRPREDGPLYFDRRRAGRHAELLALLDGESGSVDLRAVESGGEVPTYLSGVGSSPDGVYRPVRGSVA